MLGLGLSLWDCARRNGGGTPTPTPSFTTAVIEGDSMTAGNPAGTNNGSYAFYVNVPAGKTMTVRAQNSRFTGTITDLDTGNNTLMGHATEDVATYGGQLITAMIGTNDMTGGRSAATLRSDLALYWSKIKAAGGKLAISPPISLRSDKSYDNSAGAGAYDAYQSRRAAYVATIRDPAVWGLLADYYFPMGEQPELNAADNTVYISTDGVHPTGNANVAGTGQAKFLEGYQAFIDTIFDATRATSTTPASSVWPSSETNLATSTTITRRFIVKGIAHTGLALGASISGGSGTLSLNGGTPASSIGTGSGNGYRIYNGDVIDMAVTTSAANSTAVNVDLTIGSETRTISYTTIAASTPITTTGPGAATQNASTASISFPSIAVSAGTVILALTCYSSAGGTTSSLPTTITLTPTGGGTPITATLRHSGGRVASRVLAFYAATVASSGNYDVTGTRPAAATANVLAWVTLLDADIAQISTVAFNFPANEADPHLTNSATVPANGIAIGAVLKESNATGSCPAGSQTTFLVDQYQLTGGNTAGVLMGYRTTTGALSFNNSFGTWGRGAIVIKAMGT